MGIRFYCSSCGHKLNVKSFLAGKRGVCPECGSGLDIPLDSTIQKGAPKYNPDFVPSGNGDGSREPYMAAEQAGAAFARPQAGQSTPPISGGRGAAAAVAEAQPRLMPRPTPLASSHESAAAPVISVPTRARQQTTSAVPVATPVVVAPADPIAEAPDASWYVRPPSGGEYGPAPGETMRKWINEGRVSANSLVWRVGWEDWKNAGSVFPTLGGAPAPPTPAPLVGSRPVTAPADPGASTRYRPRSRNSTALAITTVVVLGLMSLALLITLILILNR